MIEVGTVINNRLRVDRVLGEGGMGVVVCATHLELGHRVAIKFLRDELSQNQQIVERFLREARSVVNLRTDHVCRVLDVGRLDSGAPYIVMEMLEGSDLARTVAKNPLPLTTAVEYVMQACVALAEAHQAGIIHRDLKPANLFVTRRLDGGPLIKVLDFGIAKALTDSNLNLTSQSPMGSPGYMSPEQIHSARDVDVRTDIWALGVTLYQLLTARLPWNANSMAAMAIKVGSDPPDPIDVDPALRAIVFRCLEKDRSRRYPDVAELTRDLVRFGGPHARGIAATVAQITAKTYQEPPLPVSGNAPTMATGMGTGPGIPQTPMQRGVTPPPTAPQSHTGYPAPQKSRAALFVIGAVVIAGAGIGIGFLARGGNNQPQQQVAVVRDASVATPVPPPQPPADASEATVAPPVDAGGLVAIGEQKPPPKQPKPPKLPKQPPATGSGSLQAASGSNATLPKQQPAQQQPSNDKSVMHPVWEAACSAVKGRFASIGARTMPPGMFTKCMCLKGDQGAAQEAYLRISRDDRESPRTECAKLGIKLHD